MFFLYDAPIYKQLYFQPPATNAMELIMSLQSDVLGILMVICTVVFVSIMALLYWYENSNDIEERDFDFTHDDMLEALFVTMPVIIVLGILSPSLMLLYNTEFTDDDIVHYFIKVTGRQWYWNYNMMDMEPGQYYSVKNSNYMSRQMSKIQTDKMILNSEQYNSITRFYFWMKSFLYSAPKIVEKQMIQQDIPQNMTFDSYMIPQDRLMKGTFSLLEVDKSLMLPVKLNGVMTLTSNDVIHSWAVPSLGLKMDCCPGRLNQLCLSLNRQGIFFGQCSELCGVNHSFMPIVVQGVYPKIL